MSINVNDKNIGHATAYAYAVAGGYTGTEAAFTELLGNIADDLGQIENLTVTVETLAAGSSATASYSNGVLHLGIPKGDKGDGAYHVEPSGESFVIHTDADGIVTSAQEIRISINARQGTSAMVISSVTGLPNISLAGGGDIAPEILKNAFTGSVATIIYTIPANSQITAEQINAQYIARINNGTPNGYGISCSLSVAVVKDGAKGDTGATGSTGPTGNGIASVAKTGTSGLVDTYTITYTNGNTSTFTVTNGAEAVDNTLTIAGRAADAKKTGDEISELKEDTTQLKSDLDTLQDITTYVETVSGERVVSTSGYTTGMMGLDGTVYTGGSYDSYKYSGQIAVAEGDVFKGVMFRFVTAFLNGDAVSEKGGNSVSTYTVPAGVDHVVVSVSSSATSFTHAYTETERKPVSEDGVSLDKNLIFKTGAFTAGGAYNYILMTGIKASLSKNFISVFECDCVSGTDFEIGFTVSNSTPTSVKNNVVYITSTKITYDGTDYTHGVTIEGRLRVIFEQLATGRAKITLMANGVSFAQEFDYVLTATCSPFVMSDGLIANNCKYTFSCRDLQKKIWMFGDSYMSYSDARWRYYLHQYGFDDNVLINCHAGAGSVNAIAALTNLLNIGRPKYIIWGIGMNDGADTNASTPASAWVTGRDAFLALCDANRITPVFGTIPSVPTLSHEAKNAWIKASGYKYIDFAKAVGADTTSSWLGTMLSNDGVHPSVTGAKSLFSQAISDFPALTIDV